MEPLKRREFLGLVGGAAALQAALDRPASAQSATSPTFDVCIHAVTSVTFDFRRTMEGYARAGLKYAEAVMPMLRDFTTKESPAVARRMLGDLDITLVAAAGAQRGLVEPRAERAANLEGMKGFLTLAHAVGIPRMVMPSLTVDHLNPDASGLISTYTLDDYKRAVDNLREVGEIAKPYGVTMMFEFVRGTVFVNSLPTALRLVREANHPNVRVMIDTYHFWGGLSKFEDLEMLRDGELAHVHLEDVPGNIPIELLNNTQRVYPGEGIIPIRRMLEVLKRKKYKGPVSVEMFDPTIQGTDPYLVAMKVRAQVEPLIAGL
jgi:2-keto-myo-inositol isomerase